MKVYVVSVVLIAFALAVLTLFVHLGVIVAVKSTRQYIAYSCIKACTDKDVAMNEEMQKSCAKMCVDKMFEKEN